MTDRRAFLKLAAMAATATSLSARARQIAADTSHADHTLEIAPYTFEVSPKRRIETIAYNGQVPGPLLRLREGQPVTIDVLNRTARPEVVHWHGLTLPSAIDGALEEGTPAIAPGARARYTFSPTPAGFRWFHTHTFAGSNLNLGQYTGQHGLLLVEPRENPARYDQEVFLTLHDFGGRLMASDDGSMMPLYEVSTINGRTLGHNEPIQVRQGQRLLLHVLNTSATDPHWVAFSGHSLHIIALDGNPVPTPVTVPMLRLSPAERVTALVECNHPGVWIFGEVRKHIQAAGMGIVFEYAGSSGTPQWQQPPDLVWSYLPLAAAGPAPLPDPSLTTIPLVFDAKFTGHGGQERWRINGKSFPETESPLLHAGNRYRLIFRNPSHDDHPLHLHRHRFELRRFDRAETHGLIKDTVLVPSGKEVEVEFTADNPGNTLLHCHQQDHMDLGFMMVLRYA